MPIHFFPPIYSSSVWGELTGTLSDQTDLQNALDGKADSDHNHDSDYSALTHNHDSDYSAIGHNHDGVYSPSGHDHDSDYSALSHNHDGDYSAIAHNHDGVYSPSDHDHDSDYSALTHNHDGDYTLISHQSDTGNPHTVSKSQVGLSDVTNDAQLKRAQGDINSFSEKSSPADNDIVLIEDSADSYNKKKVRLSNLPGGGGGGGGLTLDLWYDLGGTRTGTNTFTFSGSSADAKKITSSLFTCTDSSGTTRRTGYVKSASESSGTVTVTVVTDTDLAASDKDFKITPYRKYKDYIHLINIPGELVADISNSQGAWLQDIANDSYLLPVDSSVLNAAAGSGAACAWNIYKNSTALFSSAQDMGTNTAFNERRPTTKALTAGDNISLRITSVGGDTSMPANIQVKLYIVPQSLFTAF